MATIASIAAPGAPGRAQESRQVEPERVPDSAFVAVRVIRPAVVVRVRRGMPLRHGLMLALAAALMVMGAVRAHRQPMHRAIIVLPPSIQGAVVT